MQTFLEFKTVSAHSFEISSISHLPTGHIVTSSFDESIKIWDSNFKCCNTLREHKANIRKIITLRDGSMASCSDDKTIIIWKDFSANTIIEGHSHFVCSIFELDDGRIISASWDNTLKIWNKNG